MPPQPTARVPLDERWDWQLDGACREADPSLFYHPRNERGRTRDNRDHAALHVCRRCPVVELCRDYAMRAREAHGVWGGLTEDEREVIFQRMDVMADSDLDSAAAC
jgi:WhiB family redox-sensing transcriptional regulator